MLIDKKNGYVLALLCEPIKSLGNGCVFGFRIHDKEILLRIGRLCDVLQIARQHCPEELQTSHTPMPANSRPVTES